MLVRIGSLIFFFNLATWLLYGYRGRFDGLHIHVERDEVLGYGWLDGHVGELLTRQLCLPLLLRRQNQPPHILAIDVFKRSSVVQTIFTRAVQCKWVETLIEAFADHVDVGTLDGRHQRRYTSVRAAFVEGPVLYLAHQHG